LMTDARGFQEHWLDIDDERMELYETMYQWNPATEKFYTAARIGPGQIVGDFGCGPGHAAIEFAKRVGGAGRVHAFDINAEFIRRTQERAVRNGLEDRVSVHVLKDARLPLSDRSLDRIVARNTLIYVADPVETLTEFWRALKPGGLAHVIEGDWRLTAVEPVPTEEWRALIEAASWVWPRPEIGRGLYGFARKAGFSSVEVQVLTSPDMDGRLGGMIQTVAGYARESGAMDPSRVDRVVEIIEQARLEGRYLAISPQFIVTATR
jgi:SAM-dependent methyltransferase